MASQAEVDLIISTADTLPELERDLQRIINTAEDGAPQLDVEAALAVGASLANIAGELDNVVTAAESGASDVELEAALDAQRSLAHIQGQIESLVDRASRGEDIELQAELDQVGSLTGVSNQLRTLVAEAEAITPPIEIDVQIDEDRSGERGALRFARALSSVLPSLTRVSGGILGVGLAAASTVPLMAGIATAVESIAPASAVAVSGLLTLALVGGTTALAFRGVGDAVKSAFDPEASPEDLAKAMENLAPNARAFVTELRSMGGEFKELQQTVQDNFFAGFDDALEDLGRTVLPVVGNALRVTSQTLNQMALSAAAAASQLGQDGTLGRALSSSNVALLNLAKTPGQVVTALGQLGAAAGPSFERITAAAAASASSISERLGKAFESGALEDAIDGAVDAIAQLGRIAGNVFGGIGNVLSTVSSEGEGLFSTLEKVTQAFEDVTASKGFQDALTALIQTAGVLIDTVLPLIGTALGQLGPVFQALAAPVQILVRALGEGLGQVFEALGPVLVSLANAFGQLVLLVTPFIKLAATLISAILPALTPLFDALGQAFNAMIPFVEQLVSNVSSQLLPVLTALATEVLPQLLPPFVELATKIFPVLTEILVELAPSLAKLGEALGQVLVAVTPLLVELANLTIQLVDELAPILKPLLDLIINLVELGLKVFTAQLTGLVVPAIKILVDLLRGDFSAAWSGTQTLVQNVANKIGEVLASLRDRAVEILADLGRQAVAKINEMTGGALTRFADFVSRSVAVVRELPGRIRDALGDLGNLLTSAGSDIVAGLINGLKSQLGRLKDAASQIASTVKNTVTGLLDINSPSRVMSEVGNDTMDGFIQGIGDRLPDLRKELQGVASLVPQFALPDGRSIQLPQFQQSAPVVQVYLGNERLDGHFDARIAQAAQARERIAIQGVRR
jgi:phage-related protein